MMQCHAGKVDEKAPAGGDERTPTSFGLMLTLRQCILMSCFDQMLLEALEDISIELLSSD